MSNKVVDNREEQRIADDAAEYANGWTNEHRTVPKLAYIAGATKEAERNKEDAIGFAEWIKDETLEYDPLEEKWVTVDYGNKTTEQLYEIYINQKV